MPQLLCKCGAPATAARLYPGTENRPLCVLCASIDRLEIPSTPERSVAIPDHLIGSRSQQIHPHNTVYNHQAVALNLLNEGHNVVVSTPTASGKTLVFMMHVLHITETDPDATALVFYPAKALANDQLIRWKAAANAAEMDPEAVQQITGDTPMRQREAILNRAKVALVTPDVVHAWLIRTARGPAQKRFLANLRVAVTDEAHVYEDVLGSNAAFMFRRLDAATTHAQNRYFIQYIAATATIRSPEIPGKTHEGPDRPDLHEGRSGRERSTHTPHPAAPCALRPGREKPGIGSVPAAHIHQRQRPKCPGNPVHDSRQGAERIASMARRPHQIVPYRAGYLPEERRQIEDKIRSRDLRGVVTTSALEVGIDMPDLNFGINCGLPPTRKQMRQRLGKVGRSSPATFVILGDSDLFRRHSENLQAYYNGTIEETRLYLDNPYIAYQHALCLQRESPETSGNGTSGDPDSPEWPDVFHDTMALAQSGQPPVSLARPTPVPSKCRPNWPIHYAVPARNRST